MMKKILVFGAGRSSGSLIEYLITQSVIYDWQLIVADNNLSLALSKTANAPHSKAVCADIGNDEARRSLIRDASIVISMLPPALHFMLAEDCIEFKKDLLTASYIDSRISALDSRIKKQGLLFLYEMGLDPGIDHMSAMQLINRIKSAGAIINSFESHTGGLVAPESDNNPWHYKISWNPRNVVLAGASGGVYKEDGEIKQVSYSNIFDHCKKINIPGLDELAYYPNRDSLKYIPTYSLEDASSFIRTTLRHPAYCEGWNKLVKAGLTDDKKKLETSKLSLSEWSKPITDFLNDENVEQYRYLGLFSEDLVPAKANNSADVLQYLLEQKLAMQPEDKDMIVMCHVIKYELYGRHYELRSSLIAVGENSQKTAMSKTVGLPLGIAAKLILLEKIRIRGLHIPILPEIYEPVLKELEENQIHFEETVS
jgi:saccharopine dehydrogenase-like NADP-dependent oxidoreductase